MVSENVFLALNSVKVFTFALILSAETTFIMSSIFESVWANAEIVNNKNKMRRLFSKINFRELKYKRKVFCVQLNSRQYYLFKSNK